MTTQSMGRAGWHQQSLPITSDSLLLAISVRADVYEARAALWRAA
jgi:hypothetical protein